MKRKPQLSLVMPDNISKPVTYSYAVAVRFEECLIQIVSRGGSRGVIDFATSSVLPRAYGGENSTPVFCHFVHPAELVTYGQQLSGQVRWKYAAQWFLKALMREPGITIYVLSNHPTQVVERKIATSGIRARVLGPALEYDYEAGMYKSVGFSQMLETDRLLQMLAAGKCYQRVLYVDAFPGCCVGEAGITCVLIGKPGVACQPGSFVVRNFLEAYAVIRAMLGCDSEAIIN